MTHALARLWRRYRPAPAPTPTRSPVGAQAAFYAQLAEVAADFQRSMEQVGESIRTTLWPSLQEVAEGVRRFAEAISPYYQANLPEHVAGLEGRYLVRAGLDPIYADPLNLNLLVQRILTGEAADLAYVSDENRSLVAAAAIRGWVGSYAGAEAVRVLAWHRKLGNTRIVVGRVA